MPNYQNGLIYKLCCKDTNITDFYIGSTTSFRHRKSQHKSDCNNEKRQNYNCKLYNFIRENGGWENWDMILIEYYKCDTKLELEKKEREIIENLKPTLNKSIPTRTDKEYQKQYREDNKEKIKDYDKIRYENNKEKLLEKRKEFYEKNKDKILEKQQEKITCECGAIIVKCQFNRHLKSIKHNGYIALKNNIDII